MSREESRGARGVRIKELRARCQSTAAAPERETVTGKRLIRTVSIYLTKGLLSTGLTPNQVTFLSVVVFYIGLFLYLPNQYALDLVGAFLVYFNAVLDACDGEIARFRKLQSPVGGAYSEPVSHDVQYGWMLLVLGVAVYFRSGNVFYILISAAGSIAKLLTRLLDQRYWNLTKPVLTQDQIKELRMAYFNKPSWVRFLAWTKRNLFTSSGMIVPLAIATLFGRVDWYVIFYSVCFVAMWALVFLKQLIGIRNTDRFQTGEQPNHSE